MSPRNSPDEKVNQLLSSWNVPKSRRCDKLIEYVRRHYENIMNMPYGETMKFASKIRASGVKGIEEHEVVKKRKSVEDYFQARLKRNIKFKMLSPEYFREENRRNKGILRSAVSVGVYKGGNNAIPYNKKRNTEFTEGSTNDVLPYVYDKENIDRTIMSHEDNYKSWLGEKLHLTWEEMQQLTVEEIDEKVNKILDSAIGHVLRYFEDGYMSKELGRGLFQSSRFGIIHKRGKGQKTFFQLLKMYFKLEKERIAIKKKGLINSRELKDIEMSQFEIQRLFGLAILYNNRSKHHEFGQLSQDKLFIIGKLQKLLMDNCTINGIKPRKKHNKKNKCPNTVKTRWYIIKNDDGTYTTSNQKPASGNYIERTFNSAILEGKTEYYRKNPELIGIQHIQLRTEKDAQSSVDKIFIRGLSSFSQIMDHKGIVIVLDSYDNIDKLEAMLTNELGTKETSWAQEFEISGKLNHQTSNSYKVKKGIILVPYKASVFKKRIEELEIHLKKLNEEMKESCCENPEIEKAIREIKKTIKYLKNRVRKGNYNLKVEIQVFDTQNYIKAEIDPDSPAYHGTYKDYQRTLDVFPILFPSEIYGEKALRKFMIPIIERKLNTEGTL